ncbi:putative skeletal organic matrix protein 5 [Oculina patagonica]
MDSGKVPVFCLMTSLGACGGGGWTLVMKIDGAKTTFRYDSYLWSNKVDFNLPGGKTGFDNHETKLPSYCNTPFSKICLGMKIGQQINFIVINKQANSLYSLIADGQYRATSLGRNKWKTLIGSHASLQTNCNKEGFNALSGNIGSAKARIDFLGNQQNDCSSSESRIEFGTGGVPDDSNTCGNAASSAHLPDNGGKNIKAMGYILVQ